MIRHIASPTADERVKSDESPYTWSDYTNKIGFVFLARHVNATTIIIICCMIPMTMLSLSKMMSILHIQSQGPIPNVATYEAN